MEGSKKFETLLNRFEGYVQGCENAQGAKSQEQLLAKFESLI